NDILDPRTRRLETRWKPQMSAELFHFFVQSKTGMISSDLKKHAAGLTKVNGVKIGAIDHSGYVVIKFHKTVAPLQLLGLALGAKSNVMHRTGPDTARPCSRHTK